MECEKMQNFKKIYLILRTLERAMKSGEIEELFRLGIAERELISLCEMLQDERYIKDFQVQEFIGGQKVGNYDGVKITLRGLEYLNTNPIMENARKELSGI